MPVTILSPHMDDAVLSCFHVLGGEDAVRVVNVFAGTPRTAREPGWWDALTGATDPSTRIAERIDEDRRALTGLGCDVRYLGFVDSQYRRRSAARTAVERAIVRESEGVLYAPAGLAGHPDHIVVRDSALALRAQGAEVRLYADLPHAIVFGWPGWVTGEADARYLRTESVWETWLAGAGLRLRDLTVHAHALDGAFAAKRAAVAAYRTQAPALALITPEGGLRFELVWSLPEGAA